MFIGFIVGIVVAIVFIVAGVVMLIQARENQRKGKWATFAIIFGVVALISAAVNYNLFS